MGDMISNSRLFIDFGATPGGSGGGAIWLQRVQNIKVTDERGTEVKKAMGVKGGAGFIRKQGGGTIVISEYRQDIPQVRWRRLLKDGKVFGLSLQDGETFGEGVREKWFDVTVSKVDRSGDDDGNHMDEIELKFLSSEEST
jgi:hypothetical protein